MKKLLLSALFFATSAVYAQTPAQIVQQSYPNYSGSLKCRLYEHQDDAPYCMHLLHTETRTTPQGKLMYLLFGGNYIDSNTGKEESYHVMSGLAGLFVLREKTANDWELLAKSIDNSVGSFGTAPVKSAWSFHEFGKDKWGFLTTHSDVHQGHAGSHFVILAHDGGRKIINSWIGKRLDNAGAYGDCEYFAGDDGKLSPKERNECLNKLTFIEGSLKIMHHAPTVNGFYPLKITLSGNLGRKKYRNQAYTIPFNAAKQSYVIPKNYPLKDIEY